MSAVHPVEHDKHPHRLSNYKPYADELNTHGIDFPTLLSQIRMRLPLNRMFYISLSQKRHYRRRRQTRTIRVGNIQLKETRRLSQPLLPMAKNKRDAIG